VIVPWATGSARSQLSWLNNSRIREKVGGTGRRRPTGRSPWAWVRNNAYTSCFPSIRPAQGIERLGPRIVKGPQGIEGGKVQEFPGALRAAGQNDLAAVLLGQRVAAQKEGKEDRAEIAHLAQVDDNPGRRVLLERIHHHLGGLLDQDFVHALHFRGRDDHGDL